mmetsp:Transcript_44876/g.54340  ORF Transcript_44876/g.54340 Transcript_44876/m.54340 type:complete len:211 (-) Transcript_44876:124-756(-)|eukprot:CAMPEP_0172494558 /NCGR_PEP_ID=MMETSP1066-20121228/51214_1 /TAXON_ID=671091 /ORGANISM="Coscinodiscus wailesii, Strain CCMP2513" /LENGTH=210 /DNA_ID=CAMNT_0013265629 /DNA_START=25 /DNA_END=657 /DNA_ORIENTATION=+
MMINKKHFISILPLIIPSRALLRGRVKNGSETRQGHTLEIYQHRQLQIWRPFCPTGWTPYGKNKCLKAVDQGDSFAGHESNCQDLAPEGWLGSLVSFHSQHDLDEAGTVCRTLLDYSDGCHGGYACRTGLHYDGKNTVTFTDGSDVDYLPLEANIWGEIFSWKEGTEQCAQLADDNDDAACNNLRTFADGGDTCSSYYHKNKGLCQIWLS